VTGYLLDTNIALLGLVEPRRLSASIRGVVERGPTFLSVISYWEVLLKSMRGKLDVGDARAWWSDALDNLAATPLPLFPSHIADLYSLEPIHQDPFDRALIAQAISENLPLVTMDSEIRKYASSRFRVVS
jgi:PIN domain nuclease of toxin-antitoxin system